MKWRYKKILLFLLNDAWELSITAFRLISTGWWSKKVLDLKPSSPNHEKFSLKMFCIAVSVISLPIPVSSWRNDLQYKIYSKIYSIWGVNTYNNITTFRVIGIRKLKQLKNGLRFFYEIKKLLSYDITTTSSEVIIF